MFKRAVHLSVILKDELDELGATPTEFARQIDVPCSRWSEDRRAPISRDATAKRDYDRPVENVPEPRRFGRGLWHG